MGVAEDFGFDKALLDLSVRLVDPVYKYYWRIELEGAEHIPESGPCLLVGNHGGVLPFDAAMVKLAIYKNHPHRHVWVLIEKFVTALPFLNVFYRKTGQVLACTENSRYLLSQGEAVLVFPEGVRGIGKPYNKRYQLRRFGRGGFVRIARESRTPIIPVAIIGSEEIYRLVGKIKWPFKYFGIPFLPVTSTFPLLGPFGLIPKPTKWRIRILPAITEHLELECGPDEDPEIQRIADLVRSNIQTALRDMLRKRKNLYL